MNDLRKVYMVQPNSKYGNSIYFPYAAGSLIAYAFKDEIIKSNYEFNGFVYKKTNIHDVVQSLDTPFLVGFSCYVWNYEYNKKLAELIKDRYPECTIVFGGHQIYKNSDILNSGYVDYCIFGEGEEAFKQILLSQIGLFSMENIHNIAYRQNSGFIFTAQAKAVIPERVSPYLEGYFDELVEEEKELVFSAILETNRGCPYKCAFCDWGNEKSKIKIYDIDIIKSEIDWMADKKIEYCYCADANFGFFDRDKDIAEYLIKKKLESGYPEKFQATYSKNKSEAVFEINKRLNEVKISKGATLSFQSMHQNVLNEIYRENMPIENFHKLMRLYNENSIATYSELILGLPGETYQSFVDGIEQLLECGQHMSINFFNCELLSNSIMNDQRYIDMHKIDYAITEQHQYHVVPNDTDITEYSKIVVSTSTMSKRDWIRSNIFSVFIRAFHNLGLLQCIAIYLYYEKGIRYIDFYSDIINKAKTDENGICRDILSWLEIKYNEVLNNSGSLTCVVSEYGELTWPLDEGAFLKIVLQYDRFYNEIEKYIQQYFDDQKIFEELILYQKNIIKTPNSKGCTLNLGYDFYKYYMNIYKNHYIPLQKTEKTIVIDSSETPTDLEEYAKKIIWYGRKGGQNIIKKVNYVGN